MEALSQANLDLTVCFTQQQDAGTRLRQANAHSFGGHVKVNDGWDAFFWCKAFGCTTDELRRAVGTVGSSAAAVHRHFTQYPPARA